MFLSAHCRAADRTENNRIIEGNDAIPITNKRPTTLHQRPTPTLAVTPLPPVHSRWCLWDDEALLQVTQYIVQHPHVGWVTLLGVVRWPHGF